MIRLALCLFLAISSPAQAECRKALALGLDVSGSVDAAEYRLQLDGVAAALMHPDVQAALMDMPGAPIRLAVFEWSDGGYQRLLMDWTPLAGLTDIQNVAQHLNQIVRTPAPSGTALGQAMLYGAALLADQPTCWFHVLDLSGDGRHNTGPHPRDVKAELSRTGLTINALAIGTDARRKGDQGLEEINALSSYFQAWVILGPDAFVESALGFDDFEAALIRKLLRELEMPVLSTLQSEHTIVAAR